MAGDVFTRIRNYFQGVADALEGTRDASAIFPNTTDAGSSREDLFLHFLRTHVPKRCEVVRGGFIFDADGNESHQLDIIVTNDLTLQFRPIVGASDAGKSFNCIDGCYAAVSVKSLLDKSAIVDCIENLASIPPTPPLQLNPFLKAGELIEEMPIRLVFAFEGIKPTTSVDHLNAYYAEHKIPTNRQVNMIVVNNSYVIIRTGAEGGTTRAGDQVPPHTYYAYGWQTKHIGGFSLLSMIAQIQTVSNAGAHLLMSFNRYIDLIPIENEED